METLFHLTTEELSKICVEAEFDEEHHLILDEKNCIHQNGFMLFKQPIYAKRGCILGGVASREIIIKKTKEDSTQIYLLAMTESSSDDYDKLLYDFFDSENCSDKGCMILKTRSANWVTGSYIMEVDCNESL